MDDIVKTAAIDRGPEDFSELLLIPKVGARTIFALAMAFNKE
jgi:hypothetical protein